jgi:opacity protein-like surface antigen
MYGRGVFNFPTVGNASTGSLGANLAYNIAAGSIGADYRLTRSINLRAEYEYQRWMGFPPNGLTPTVASIGAAYHFH